jgi:hypothetical protein
MNKETFRSFLNVPEKLPHNYRVKLEQDLILVPLFNSEGTAAFKSFLNNLVPSNVLDFKLDEDSFKFLLTYTNVDFSTRVNPLLTIAFDKSHILHDLLIKLLYRFHDQRSLDLFLDKWWDSKKNFVSVLSTYDGWSDKNFALKVSGSTSNGMDYQVGTDLFTSFVRRYRYWRQVGLYKMDSNYSIMEMLRFVISEAYRIIVLDNIKVPQQRDILADLPYQTLSGDMMSYKSYLFIQQHLKDFPITSNVDGKFVDLFADKYGYKFNDLNSLLFFDSVLYAFDFITQSIRTNRHTDFSIDNHRDYFLSALLVSLRANKPQLSKQVAVKKLVRMIIELNYIESLNDRSFDITSLEGIEQLNFTNLVNDFSNSSDNKLNTHIKFKVRNASNTGFTYSDNPSYQQAFQKLIECFSCKSIEQTFVINLHPVAQLFSSHFTNASSCHNMVDLRASTAHHTVSSLGQFHKGQFQVAAAGGFLVAQYDSYPEDLLCFKPMDYRAQLFITPELDMIRQHLAYPGRNNDELAKAEAKTYRNIIHELLSPWHGGGTEMWLASKPNTDNGVSTNGFNWQPSVLNKRGDTLQETKEVNYLGYSHEITFAFSHIIYPTPTNFKLPIVKGHYPLTSNGIFVSSPDDSFYYYNRNRSIASPKLFLTVNGLSSTWDNPYVHSLWTPVDKPLVARDNKNKFLISSETPHSSCSKCNTIILGIGLSSCESCMNKFTSNLFSNMVNQSANPIYFNYKTSDDLSTFLNKVSRSSNIVWKNSDSLVSFIPNGPNFLLVLKDGKLSIKVTKPKDTLTIIDVSSVVFE